MLPQEILRYHLVDFLGPHDIINLVKSGCLTLVDEELYNRVFQDSVQFEDYNADLFLERARARLYIFGDVQYGRLGVSLHSSSLFETVTYREEGTIKSCFRLTKPVKVPYKGITSHREGDIDTSKNLCGRRYTSTKLMDITNKALVPLTDAMDENSVPPVSKVRPMARGTWFATRFVPYLYNEGSPYDDLENVFSTAEAVMDTEHHVVGHFFVSPSDMIYLHTDGTVRRARVEGSDLTDTPVDELNLHKASGFTSLQSCRLNNHFVLLRHDGALITARVAKSEHSSESPCPIQDTTVIEGLDIVSISAGNYHTLALSKQGDVYSWGEEHKLNGCLGYGKMKKALRIPGVHLESVSGKMIMVQETPTKINLPGKALAVTACKNWSSVLVAGAGSKRCNIQK